MLAARIPSVMMMDWRKGVMTIYLMTAMILLRFVIYTEIDLSLSLFFVQGACNA